MFLQNLCLEAINKYSYTRRHTDWWERFMKYAIEMGSGTMMYIPSFIKIGSGIHKLIRRLHRHTDWWKRFMKYAIDMGSGAMMYIPSFIKIGPGIQKLIRGLHRHTDAHIAWRSHKPTSFFQNKESRLENNTSKIMCLFWAHAFIWQFPVPCVMKRDGMRIAVIRK
jgi:hypothetical protein